MTIAVHGQHEGRADRIEQTMGWLGAIPPNVPSGPLPPDPGGLSETDFMAVYASIELARQTLTSKAAAVAQMIRAAHGGQEVNAA